MEAEILLAYGRCDGSKSAVSRFSVVAESIDSLIPHEGERWHIRSLNDCDRNDKFNQAIRRAISNFRSKSEDAVLALDIGAGSGILSLMAERAGANKV